MKTFLMIVLAIACIILIVSVLLQSGNSSGKKKSRGYEAILAKITTGAAILFVVLSVALVMID